MCRISSKHKLLEIYLILTHFFPMFPNFFEKFIEEFDFAEFDIADIIIASFYIFNFLKYDRIVGKNLEHDTYGVK